VIPGRLESDESGVALGLAVILVVLVGVMAAGLLAFVRNDLEAVITVNQGQGALSLADAGVQAARTQLGSDAEPGHYDADPAENVEWAYVAPDGETSGKSLILEDGTVRVEIQYLLPSTTAAQTEEGNHAPELHPSRETYFKVTSEGTVRGARRKVEAILYTTRLDVPAANHTPNETTSTDSPTRPGSYAVKLWTWRELFA